MDAFTFDPESARTNMIVIEPLKPEWRCKVHGPTFNTMTISYPTDRLRKYSTEFVHTTYCLECMAEQLRKAGVEQCEPAQQE